MVLKKTSYFLPAFVVIPSICYSITLLFSINTIVIIRISKISFNCIILPSHKLEYMYFHHFKNYLLLL